MSLCVESDVQRCSVVVLVHGDTDVTYGAAGGDSGGYVEHGEKTVASLAHELDHIADVVISVDPLSTGLANDVHGQVATLIISTPTVIVLFTGVSFILALSIWSVQHAPSGPSAEFENRLQRNVSVAMEK